MSGQMALSPKSIALDLFQSPDGDSLCPDCWCKPNRSCGIHKFQSPDGDSLCPDEVASKAVMVMKSVFQSPDGDSLCPDHSPGMHGGYWAIGFSPLTGILYVRTTSAG